MENKYNDNELDRWLRENAKTGNPAPAPDGWDSPPETVWTGLRAGLDARKKRRRLFLVLWLVVLVALLGGLGYWNIERLQTATQVQTTSLNPETATIQQRLNTPKETPASEVQVPKKKFTENQHQTSSPNPQTATTARTTKQPTLTQINQTTNTTKSIASLAQQEQLARPEPFTQTEPTAISTPEKMEDAASQPQAESLTSLNRTGSDKDQAQAKTEAALVKPAVQPRNLALLEALPVLPIQPLNWIRPVKMPTANITPIVPQKMPQQPKPSLFAGATSGVFFTSRKLQKQNGKMPDGQESGTWVWQQGLRLGLQLNQHWSFESGLQRTCIRLQADRTIQFQYQTDHELFNPQRFLYQNTTDQVIQTSFGAVEMRMDIGREPNRPISDQAKLEINLRTDEKVNYLRIPVLLGYSAGNKAWQWNVRAGLGINIENGYELRLTAARTDRPGVRDISARARKRAIGLAPAMLDMQISAGLQYRLTPQWAILLAPEFRYGLGSMYQNGPFRSLAVSTGINFGVTYDFGTSKPD